MTSLPSTTVAIHQPDLLPYSGYWFKMINSDVYIIAKHDQFQKHGYQRRVKMRDSWCSHQLDGKPALVPITDVVVLDGWQDRLVNTIRGRYQKAPYFKTRGAELIERIQGCGGTHLDEVNLSMIHVIRDMLGITTPLAFTDPPPSNGADRLIWQTLAVGGDAYLSGSGGAAYLGDDAEQYFADHGIKLMWSDHRHVTGDSIVTVLMDADDPMQWVRRSA